MYLKKLFIWLSWMHPKTDYANQELECSTKPICDRIRKSFKRLHLTMADTGIIYTLDIYFTY